MCIANAKPLLQPLLNFSMPLETASKAGVMLTFSKGSYTDAIQEVVRVAARRHRVLAEHM